MKNLTYWLQNAVLRALLACIAPLGLDRRRRIVGAVTERVIRMTPLARRIRANLMLVWPEMPADRRERILRETARNVGRTLTGVWFNDDLARDVEDLSAEGPGLEILRAARADGRGAIIVSGHFGQWEAIRHVLRREGLETGAVYRPNNNPYYEPIFREGIERGGLPIIAKGRAGNRELLRHLRSGGFMALLPDQYVKNAPWIPFLGQPARTSLSAAELALRYDLPLIPAFAPEIDGRLHAVIEAPIPPSDPEEMMRQFNDRLSSWVTRHPSQWHWLHRRWKATGGKRARSRAART